MFMDITKWTNRELIKYLVSHAGTTQEKLAVKVFELTKQDYKPNTFTNKLANNNLKLKEFQAVCETLGYRLELKEIIPK